MIDTLIFRQLFDKDSYTFTYLIADPNTRETILIDSVIGKIERDLILINQLQLNLRYAIETHIHADHITAAGLLREKTGCSIIVPPSANVRNADIYSQDNQVFTLGSLNIKVIATPGHTDCSSCYLINNQWLFTGDTLLIRGCGRTDFQNGDAALLYNSITEKLFNLDEHILIYPGHDYNGQTSSSIMEEKKYNPRLANKSVNEFVQIMENLNLAKPKLIDKAVPANQHSGLDND